MKIAVIGLGLIGGSFCKAITKYTNHTVLGYNRTLATAEKALAEGSIQQIITLDQLDQADLTMVCLHPIQTIQFLLDHKNDFAKGSIVIDASGVKESVLDAVDQPLKEAGVRFVGCHPMAGREYSGYDYTLDTLFIGASFILTPTPLTDPVAVETVEQLARELGFGQTVRATPREHDEIIAATSQLAHVVSNAYIKSPTLQKEAGFSAGSFLDLTRVAKLNEDMWTDLFMMNRKALLQEIDYIQQAIGQMRDALEAKDADTLKALLREGRLRKEESIRRHQRKEA